MLVPILVAPNEGRYITVAGGYRRDAARLAGHTHIPAIILPSESDDHLTTSAVENLHRSNLSPVEEAEVCRLLVDQAKLPIDQVAARIGYSESWVISRLDLLTWDPIVLHAVHTGQLSQAAARPLAGVANDDLRARLVEEAVRYGATARTTATWASTAKLRSDSASPADAGAIISAPIPSSPRLVARCWMCHEEHDLASMTHAPTCSHCTSAVLQASTSRGAP